MVVKSLYTYSHNDPLINTKRDQLRANSSKSDSLGDNFIGIQSLNVSDAIFEGSEMEEESQDDYSDLKAQLDLKGNYS